MKTPVIRFSKTHPDAVIPVRQTKGSAGADLHAIVEGDCFILKPGHRALISLGLRMDIPLGYEVQFRPRSGLALKHGITLVNTPGTIDSDYKGVCGVILINHGSEDFEIRTKDRIAQMVLCVTPNYVSVEVDDIGSSERGSGGFGSTGIR